MSIFALLINNVMTAKKGEGNKKRIADEEMSVVIGRIKQQNQALKKLVRKLENQELNM
jgi:hypothetical protein